MVVNNQRLKQEIDICERWINGESVPDLAADYQCSQATIHTIVKQIRPSKKVMTRLYREGLERLKSKAGGG